ncbi:MAG: type III pantothenate kinase [Bacteroidia bacterium]|jgi:type III pantothenate kinase|nr:type III pantothenate kinase [Bacteroidia bacterium]
MEVYTLDIGNTRSKLGTFISGKLNGVQTFNDHSALVEFLSNIPKESIIGCSVGKKPAIFSEGIRWVTPMNNEAVTLEIEEPPSLGADRYVGILGLLQKFPQKEVLLIDVGTCITYEYLYDKQYHGGAISPGIQLRFKSMNDYTEALPLLKGNQNQTLYIGKNTDEAMNSGVLMGVIDEVSGRIQDWQSKSNEGIVVLTGGDAEFLGNHLKTKIFVEPWLLHYGLYYAHQSL